MRSTLLHRYSLLLLVGMAVFVLLALSWPRLQASLRYLPVDTAITRYWETREIDSRQVDALIDRTHEAIALYDHYRYWDGLSVLQILSGQDTAKSHAQRRQVLEQSIASATAAVMRAPVKPRTWLRIARTGAFLDYPPEEVIPAWKMSVLTGRVEPTLMLVRLEIGFLLFNSLDDESKVLLHDQVMLAWAGHKKRVIKYLKNNSLDFSLMREILSGDNQEIILEMESHLDVTPGQSK